MRRPLLGTLLAGLGLVGCGGAVTADEADGGVDDAARADAARADAPDEVAARPDASPASCGPADPSAPPIGEGPAAGGAATCATTTSVATCPTDTACMARVKQSSSVLEHRVGRLRLYAPEPLLALAPIAIDPNVSPKCANGGSEALSWLLRIDTAAKTFTTGPARPSTDGKTFSFLNEDLGPAELSELCPGFGAATAPVPLRPATAPFASSGSGLCVSSIPQLTLAVLQAAGGPVLLPLRDANITIASLADPSCIGAWERGYWCDSATLGWTTGASLVAKISVEDADQVPVRSAGCQSLCAILVNDATKTDGKRCKRGPDGKIPPIGDACVGGAGCNNAWRFTAGFASYGVEITP